MATTGTTDFSPLVSDLIINAYGRCKIRRSAITTDHLRDAVMSCNLLQADWANMPGVNAWTVDLDTVTLVAGTSTYDLDPDTTLVMATYIQIGSPTRDRLMFAVGRDEYASYPDKTTQGIPTVYWFDRTTTPKLTFWQPPDQAYTVKFYRATQIQDASASGNIAPEVPYRFLEAYTSELSVRLAEIYAPEEMPRLERRAAMAWDRAARRDGDDGSNMYITPALGAYGGY